jgi:hypothetical protein
MFLVIVIVVLLLDLIALITLLGSSAALGQKLLWSALILALPVVGVVFYFVLTEART